MVALEVIYQISRKDIFWCFDEISFRWKNTKFAVFQRKNFGFCFSLFSKQNWTRVSFLYNKEVSVSLEKFTDLHCSCNISYARYLFLPFIRYLKFLSQLLYSYYTLNFALFIKSAFKKKVNSNSFLPQLTHKSLAHLTNK